MSGPAWVVVNPGEAVPGTEWRNASNYPEVWAGSAPVCARITAGDSRTLTERARLIAAAPELLTALEQACAEADASGTGCVSSMTLRACADAAAKARGNG